MVARFPAPSNGLAPFHTLSTFLLPRTRRSAIRSRKGRLILERLIIGPEGGVAKTVVYLKNITSGKATDLPEQRRHLDQKRCRYIPHILLVPESGTLSMTSSNQTLHTIHMD